MTTPTPQQRRDLETAMAELAQLRQATAATALPAARSGRQQPDPAHNEYDALCAAAEVLSRSSGPDWFDEHLARGTARADVLAWLTAQHRSTTVAAAIRGALDDVTVDDPPAKILRVLREENFNEAARIPDYQGRDLRLLTHRRGWLAQVDITPARRSSRGVPTARLYLSLNAYAVDHEILLTAGSWNYARRDDGARTSLTSGTVLINRIGLRVMSAVLRATTLPAVPWRTPALRPWLGGQLPPLPDDPGHNIATGLATAQTLTILTSLPAAVRTLIAPDLPTAP